MRISSNTIPEDEPIPDCEHCTKNQLAYIVYDQFDNIDPSKNAKHYNTYAQKYDAMHDKAGFNDPYWLTKVIVERLGSQPNHPLSHSACRLMDFGCGTGRLGVELKKAGYVNISGVDGSTEMINVAYSKGCYQAEHIYSLLVGIDALPSEIVYDASKPGSGFDAVLASATMLPGHFPNSCYSEMLKVLRPGGYLLFSIRDNMMDPDTDEGCNFVGKLEELVIAGEMIFVDSVAYAKYRGLDLGPCMSETPASVKIYKKKTEKPMTN